MQTQNSNLKIQNHNSNVKTDVKLRSYYFSLAVIKFIVLFPQQKIYWVFSDQLLRSATSIGANLVEAKSSSSKKDFIKFYEIALKSANETKYWLCLLRDSKLDLDSSNIGKLLAEAIELSNMLGSSLLTLKKKR